MALLRSLLFYPLFYGFSSLLVVASVLAIPFGRRPLRRVVALWGSWHRWCVENLLGVRIAMTHGIGPPNRAGPGSETAKTRKPSAQTSTMLATVYRM